jgi:hypothetical protein
MTDDEVPCATPAERIATECPRGLPASEHVGEHGLRHGHHKNEPMILACITNDAYVETWPFTFFLTEDQKSLLKESP